MNNDKFSVYLDPKQMVEFEKHLKTRGIEKSTLKLSVTDSKDNDGTFRIYKVSRNGSTREYRSPSISNNNRGLAQQQLNYWPDEFFDDIKDGYF